MSSSTSLNSPTCDLHTTKVRNLGKPSLILVKYQLRTKNIYYKHGTSSDSEVSCVMAEKKAKRS